VGRPLEARTALVTGAGGGIGGAIAVALAREGASVGLVGRRRTRLVETAEQLAGAPHAVYEADLASDPAVRATADVFLDRFRHIDILVHSNGTYSSGRLESADVRDFDNLWATNVRSPFLLTQALLPALRSSLGQIVFVNSSVVLEPRAGVGQFSATQHALRALADTLRAELNTEGIRVLSVFPGRTATERQRRIFESEGRAYDPDRLLQPKEIASVIVDAVALPRTAEVTEIIIRQMIKPVP
jgi:NADP-dependent 3-hydroxy acid dehydrogenase YdfG